jgi:hypothetical protein
MVLCKLECVTFRSILPDAQRWQLWHAWRVYLDFETHRASTKFSLEHARHRGFSPQLRGPRSATLAPHYGSLSSLFHCETNALLNCRKGTLDSGFVSLSALCMLVLILTLIDIDRVDHISNHKHLDTNYPQL